MAPLAGPPHHRHLRGNGHELRSRGRRHRAAVGLSMRCDALIVIVSEQTGRISFAEQGTLTFIDREEVEGELGSRLNTEVISEVEESETEEKVEVDSAPLSSSSSSSSSSSTTEATK